MSDATTPQTQEPLWFERSYTTGPDYAKRVAGAVFRYAFLRPRLIVLLALVVIILFSLTTQLIASGNRGGGGYAIFAIGVIVVIALVFIGTYVRALRQLRAKIPVGSVYTIGFRDKTIFFSGPLVRSEVSYGAYGKALRRGDFVFLKQSGSRLASALPAQLFTDESFAWLVSKVCG